MIKSNSLETSYDTIGLMKTANYIRLAAVIATSLFLFANCGYSLVGRGNSLPEHINSVKIPIFKNTTGEPNLDSIITRVVKEQFIKDGRLKVDDSDLADSQLDGTIVSYSISPVSFSSDNTVTTYQIELGIEIEHIDSQSSKKLMKQTIHSKWRYDVGSSLAFTIGEKRQAIEEAAENAAELIISLVIEAF